jgi:hypothetical protein
MINRYRTRPNSRAGGISYTSARSVLRRRRCRHYGPSAEITRRRRAIMTRRKQEKRWSLKDELPVVGELRECRQLAADHWQGIDEDGAIIDVHGGLMPAEYIIRSGLAGMGIVRLIHAHKA